MPDEMETTDEHLFSFFLVIIRYSPNRNFKAFLMIDFVLDVL